MSKFHSEGPFTFRYSSLHWTIRRSMVESLVAYRDHGCPVGNFLQAIIANDFAQAVGRADMENIECIPAYAAFLHNEMPSYAWGCKSAYDEWLESHQEEYEAYCEKLRRAYAATAPASMAESTDASPEA